MSTAFKIVDPKNLPEPETVSTEKSIRNDDMKKEKGTKTFEFEVKQWFMYYELIFQKKEETWYIHSEVEGTVCWDEKGNLYLIPTDPVPISDYELGAYFFEHRTLQSMID